MSVADEPWIARAARLYPDRVAVDAPDGTLTYAHLFAAASSFAGTLTDGPASPRLAIELPPGAAFAVALHGAWLRHRVVVPIDSRLPARARAVRLAGCEAVIDAAAATPFLDGATSAGSTTTWPPEAERGQAPSRDAEGDVVLWTSGSTGAGTEVRLTHENLLWNALGSAVALGQPADERWLSAMPVAHVGGFTVFTRSVLAGTTAVVRPRFDVQEQVDLLMAGEATITSVVPTMLGRMLDAGLDHPPTLRLVLLGGAPITPDLLRRAEAAGIPVTGTYGMTEACSQVVTAGAPLFCTRAVLRGELEVAGSEDPERADEILVKGPTLALGVAGPDGWLATGDRGVRRPDGSLTVVG
ncbi:MAG: AMP-binding protein [Solirubrobacteraceae bacterium]